MKESIYIQSGFLKDLERYKIDRERYIDVAEEIEKYTLSTLYDTLTEDDIIIRNQALGADLVSTLASKLVKSIFPFGTNFFKLNSEVKDETATNLLIALEEQIRLFAEENNIRGYMVQVIEHLLITGNVLLDFTSNNPSFYRLDEYVVMRRENGEWYKIIIEKQIIILPDDNTPYVKYIEGLSNRYDPTSVPDVYPFYIEITKVDKGYQIKEYIEDFEVVEKTRTVKEILLYPIQLYEEIGFNYSYGYCYRHLGDLQLYDKLAVGMGDSAEQGAKVLHLVNPASVIADNLEEVKNSKSGDFIVGMEGDLVAYSPQQVNMNVVYQNLENVERRLSASFLRGVGVIRERQTTAYEIQTLIQEMSEKFGGFYITIAHSLQNPVFDWLLSKMKIDKKLKDVKVEFINGIGDVRNLDKLNKLSALVPLEAIYQLGEAQQFISSEKVFRAYADVIGVNTDEVLKDKEEIQAEEQTQIQKAMIQQQLENQPQQGARQ